MKKVMVLLSIALLLISSVFLAGATEPELTRDEALVQEARQLYKRCLYASGRESFRGMCGLMTSYQLWKLGINESLEVYDGNKQFDAYKNRAFTTGGHDVKVYSAEDVSLLEALYAITHDGTRDARNILVCFQWTNTEAGKFFGHACVINAIQDGTVYFTESFDYAMGKMEGQVITCSMEKFAEFFSDWTRFEGCIDFGTRQYANLCRSYGTDLYLQLRFESNLRSQPCLIGQNDCQRLRSLAPGELLHATGVFVNEDGDLFYRIDDGQVNGYVSANAVYLLQLNEQSVTLQNAGIPLSIEPGEAPSFSGAVAAAGSQICKLQMEITDRAGTVVLQGQADVAGSSCDLNVLSQQIPLNTLAVGSYSITLSAEVTYATAEGTELIMVPICQELLQQTLQVGESVQVVSAEHKETVPDGWFLEKGTWYCYENGQPRTGWVTRIGVDYYLKEDGSVTTGWMEEDDKIRYFSATGALCSGWVTTREGTYYFIDEGVIATGLQQIEEKRYWFEPDGRLRTGGTVTYEETVYNIRKDGTAVPAES